VPVLAAMRLRATNMPPRNTAPWTKPRSPRRASEIAPTIDNGSRRYQSSISGIVASSVRLRAAHGNGAKPTYSIPRGRLRRFVTRLPDTEVASGSTSAAGPTRFLAPGVSTTTSGVRPGVVGGGDVVAMVPTTTVSPGRTTTYGPCPRGLAPSTTTSSPGFTVTTLGVEPGLG